jgi:hypothetical protein
MEKVENLCRTARAKENRINTSEQISSRLRDVGLRHGAAPTIAAKTLPCSSSNFARFPSRRAATIMPPGREQKKRGACQRRATVMAATMVRHGERQTAQAE